MHIFLVEVVLIHILLVRIGRGAFFQVPGALFQVPGFKFQDEDKFISLSSHSKILQKTNRKRSV